MVRENILAFVERNLSNSIVLIVDASHEMKGWRYQMHCFAKAVPTTHLLVSILLFTEFYIEISYLLRFTAQHQSLNVLTGIAKEKLWPIHRKQYGCSLVVMNFQIPLKDGIILYLQFILACH
jgi:hypothetical protein